MVTGSQSAKESYVTGSLNDKGLFWYLMPKGKVFHAENLTDIEKLTCLRHLGNTIVQLHKQNNAHRDIKPPKFVLIYF